MGDVYQPWISVARRPLSWTDADWEHAIGVEDLVRSFALVLLARNSEWTGTVAGNNGAAEICILLRNAIADKRQKRAIILSI